MTMPQRPFRFGVQVRNGDDAASWVTNARRYEELGYAAVTMPDHFDEQLHRSLLCKQLLMRRQLFVSGHLSSITITSIQWCLQKS